MLSDLVQYFTKTDYSIDEKEKWDLTEYLEYIHENTKDFELKNEIENAVINRKDGFYELFEIGFNEEMYLNDWHLSDAINTPYENTLVTTLLSTIMPTSYFDVKFEDIEISWMLSNDEKEKYSLNEYDAYSIDRKIDTFINDFILNNLYLYADEDCIDDYTAEMTRVIVSHIKLKNKSYGRRLRKAYVKDENVRKIFDELNFCFCNGELVIVMMYNIESASYNYLFDMQSIYNNLDYLRHHYFKDNLKTNNNTQFLKHLNRLNYLFSDYARYTGYYESFFQKIMEIHDCSKQEVIL